VLGRHVDVVCRVCASEEELFHPGACKADVGDDGQTVVLSELEPTAGAKRGWALREYERTWKESRSYKVALAVPSPKGDVLTGHSLASEAVDWCADGRSGVVLLRSGRGGLGTWGMLGLPGIEPGLVRSLFRALESRLAGHLPGPSETAHRRPRWAVALSCWESSGSQVRDLVRLAVAPAAKATGWIEDVSGEPTDDWRPGYRSTPLVPREEPPGTTREMHSGGWAVRNLPRFEAIRVVDADDACSVLAKCLEHSADVVPAPGSSRASAERGWSLVIRVSAFDRLTGSVGQALVATEGFITPGSAPPSHRTNKGPRLSSSASKDRHSVSQWLQCLSRGAEGSDREALHDCHLARLLSSHVPDRSRMWIVVSVPGSSRSLLAAAETLRQAQWWQDARSRVEKQRVDPLAPFAEEQALGPTLHAGALDLIARDEHEIVPDIPEEDTYPEATEWAGGACEHKQPDEEREQPDEEREQPDEEQDQDLWLADMVQFRHRLEGLLHSPGSGDSPSRSGPTPQRSADTPTQPLSATPGRHATTETNHDAPARMAAQMPGAPEMGRDATAWMAAQMPGAPEMGRDATAWMAAQMPLRFTGTRLAQDPALTAQTEAKGPTASSEGWATHRTRIYEAQPLRHPSMVMDGEDSVIPPSTLRQIRLAKEACISSFAMSLGSPVPRQSAAVQFEYAPDSAAAIRSWGISTATWLHSPGVHELQLPRQRMPGSSAQLTPHVQPALPVGAPARGDRPIAPRGVPSARQSGIDQLDASAQVRPVASRRAESSTASRRAESPTASRRAESSTASRRAESSTASRRAESSTASRRAESSTASRRAESSTASRYPPSSESWSAKLSIRRILAARAASQLQ
jgi:hypothetical protein